MRVVLKIQIASLNYKVTSFVNLFTILKYNTAIFFFFQMYNVVTTSCPP